MHQIQLLLAQQLVRRVQVAQVAQVVQVAQVAQVARAVQDQVEAMGTNGAR